VSEWKQKNEEEEEKEEVEPLRQTSKLKLTLLIPLDGASRCCQLDVSKPSKMFDNNNNNNNGLRRMVMIVTDTFSLFGTRRPSKSIKQNAVLGRQQQIATEPNRRWE
jgi:hypothetical protein